MFREIFLISKELKNVKKKMTIHSTIENEKQIFLLSCIVKRKKKIF